MNERTPAMQSWLDSWFKMISGRTLTESQAQMVCSSPSCGEYIDIAKMTDIQRREWQISGLCKSCQEKIFS